MAATHASPPALPLAGKYTSPAALAAMEVNDPVGLRRLKKETLIHLRNGGDPSEAPLVLPRFTKMPTCPQLVPGYGDDDMFDPEMLGATCIIDKKGKGAMQPKNAAGTWIFNACGRNSGWETDVQELFQTHCSTKAREGQSKKQLDSTLYKFQLETFDLYLVSAMQRTWSKPPKADTSLLLVEQSGAASQGLSAEEAGEAATCYSPPAVERRREDREVEGAFANSPPGEVEGAVPKSPPGALPTSSEDANMSRLLHEINMWRKQSLQEVGQAERRVSHMMQQLAESCEEAEQRMVAEREGRARAEAEALLAEATAQAAEEAMMAAMLQLAEAWELAGELAGKQAQQVEDARQEEEETQQRMAAEREGRARAAAAAQLATVSARAAEGRQRLLAQQLEDARNARVLAQHEAAALRAEMAEQARGHAAAVQFRAQAAEEEGHARAAAEALQATARAEAAQVGRKALCTAARKGQDEVVQALLEVGVAKDAPDWFGRTALHAAAIYSHDAVVRTLLKAGVAKDATYTDGCTALHKAALYGHDEVVRTLLQAGVAKDARDRYGQTALFLAQVQGHTAVVNALLEAGAQDTVNQRALACPYQQQAAVACPPRAAAPTRRVCQRATRHPAT